jgi:hypothetical protein
MEHKAQNANSRAQAVEGLAKRELLTPELGNSVGEGRATGQHLNKEESAKVLKAQRARANLMAIGLFCLCILFFMITIVKIGLWG